MAVHYIYYRSGSIVANFSITIVKESNSDAKIMQEENVKSLISKAVATGSLAGVTTNINVTVTFTNSGNI